MPQIKFSARNFPPHAAVPNTGELNFNWSELVWAATSVGKADRYDMNRHGVYSSFEMVFREALIYANLKETDDGLLERSAVYSGLDPSEKGAISYFLGMTATKLFCEQLLNVHWLMHLDVYKHRFDIELDGSERPDFFGKDINNDWVVIESKGRTNDMDSAVLEKAKQQSSRLTLIDGIAPVLHVGSVAHFRKGALNVTLDDPERAKEGKNFSLQVKNEEFFDGYYRPLKKLIESRPHRSVEFRELRFNVVDSESTGVSIGLVDDKNYPIDREDLFQIDRQARSEELRYVGSDGVYVELSTAWSSENMRREPQERRQ